MAPNKICELCKCELDEASFVSHILGKKHKRNVELNDSRNNTIIIKGYDYRASPRDVMNFFVNYGEIVNYFFFNGNKTLKIQYQNGEPVRHLTRNNIYFKGRKLNITSASISSNQQVSDEDLTKEDLSEKMHKDLLNILKPATNFGQQISKFLECIQESETKLEKKKLEVKEDFEKIIKRHFQCELFFFGSMAAGLGLNTSDIDIFVGLENKPEITVQESIDYVRDVCSILRTDTTKFDAVESVICSTPIVRLYHVPTELNCDITFKNRLGVYNSELLKYFISIDERVKPLIMIIKYWAKQHGFGGSKKLTSYALAMMVVFYLQQLQKPILPSVCEIQTDTKRIEAGCNAGFNNDKSLLPKTQNTQNVSELLLGFFEYFTSFDYERKLISLFSGTTHFKEMFQSPKTLPDIFKNAYVNSNIICQKLRGFLTVQDPFELHYNITSCANQSIVNMFKNFCNLGVTIFKDHSINDCNLLIQLFEEKPASESRMHATIITIEFGDHLKYLMNDSTEKEVPHNNIREQWYDKVHILIKMIFKDILNLELVEEGLDAVADSESEDDDLNVKEIKKYRYVGYANLMNNDKLLHFSKIKVLNVDKEIQYIKNLEKNEKKIENRSEQLVDFNLIFKKMINPTKVTLEFNSNVDQNIHYDHILMFSTGYLNSFIDQAIKNIKVPPHIVRQSINLQKELNKVEKLTLPNEKDPKEQTSNFTKGLTESNPSTNKKSKNVFRPDTNNEIGKFLFNNVDGNTQKKQQLYPNKHGCYMFSNKPFFYKDDIKPPDFVWERGYEKKD